MNMKKVIHTAESRGFFNHGWLITYHSFSFEKYNNPQRVNFGALRVLNDDFIVAGKGFSQHHHDNMEIVSIPLSGLLAHEDSTGQKEILKPGDVQVMSAGSGIVHAEYNGSDSEEVNFIQLWIYPDKRNNDPQYQQKSFNPEDRQNKIQTFISPWKSEDRLWLNQDAYISWAQLDKNFSASYKLNRPENGVYIFNISGSTFVEHQPLQKRDGIGLWEISEIKIESIAHSETLIIEIPMLD